CGDPGPCCASPSGNSDHLVAAREVPTVADVAGEARSGSYTYEPDRATGEVHGCGRETPPDLIEKTGPEVVHPRRMTGTCVLSRMERHWESGRRMRRPPGARSG